jgi:phage terminase small subunit
MNVRQQMYKKNVLLGMSKYNAAIAAGYSESTAKTHTKQLDVRVRIEDTMERKGLTDQALVDKLIELLSATKVIGYLHNYKKEEKGRFESVSPDEVMSNEFLDIPDNAVRAKALELALKLKGNLRDKIDHSVDIKYTQMAVIKVQHEPLELDLGDMPGQIRERMDD